MVKAQWGTFIIRINESSDGSAIGDSTKESTRNSNDGCMDFKDKTCTVENTKERCCVNGNKGHTFDKTK